MAALADAGDDEPRPWRRQSAPPLRQRAGKAVVQRLFQRHKARILGLYRSQRRSDGRFRIRQFLGDIKLFHGAERWPLLRRLSNKCCTLLNPDRRRQLFINHIPLLIFYHVAAV